MTRNNAQQWCGQPGLGFPDAAAKAAHAVVAHDQFQFARHSSRRAGRWTSLGRPNSRACSGFFFTPRLTLDGIHEPRICELTGRHPVLARSRCNVGHHVIYHAFDVPKRHSYSPSSFVASDVKHDDREGFGVVRISFRGARNDF